jgi:hypothetical protein
MNTNLASIIKRIITEQGEDILANPQRVKGYVNDYAAHESKVERLVFCRCIEHGAYTELKSAPDAEARQRVKAALAQKVNGNEGLELALCNDALDALEAAMFGAPAPQAKTVSPEAAMFSGKIPSMPPEIVPPKAASTAPEKGSPVYVRILALVLVFAGVQALIYKLGFFESKPPLDGSYFREDNQSYLLLFVSWIVFAIVFVRLIFSARIHGLRRVLAYVLGIVLGSVLGSVIFSVISVALS